MKQMTSPMCFWAKCMLSGAAAGAFLYWMMHKKKAKARRRQKRLGKLLKTAGFILETVSCHL